MKIALKIIPIFCLAALLAGCETYGEPEVGYTSVAPLDGRWECFMYDFDDYSRNGDAATPLQYTQIQSSNTSDGVNNKMWFNIVLPTSPVSLNLISSGYPTDVLSVKVDCNPKAKTFSVLGAVGALTPPYVYNPILGGTVRASPSMEGWVADIEDGTVQLKGIETPSSSATEKYYTDLISFTLELDTPIDGIFKFKVVGGRFTGWEDDYADITDFVDWQMNQLY